MCTDLVFKVQEREREGGSVRERESNPGPCRYYTTGPQHKVMVLSADLGSGFFLFMFVLFCLTMEHIGTIEATK